MRVDNRHVRCWRKRHGRRALFVRTSPPAGCCVIFEAHGTRDERAALFYVGTQARAEEGEMSKVPRLIVIGHGAAGLAAALAAAEAAR